MKRLVALCIFITLLFPAACEAPQTPVISPAPSPIEVSVPADTSAPIVTVAPTAEPLTLPVTLPADFKRLAWDGDTPALPDDLPAWSYRGESYTKDMDLEAVASKIFGEGNYSELIEPDKLYDKGYMSSDKAVSILSGGPGAAEQYLVSYVNNLKPDDLKALNIGRNTVRTEAAEYLDGVLGGHFTAYPMYITALTATGGELRDDNVTEYTMGWGQRLNGFELEDSYLEANYTSEGLRTFALVWQAPQPVETTVPGNLITLEQALAALDYYRYIAAPAADWLNIMNYSEVNGVSIVYTKIFDKEDNIYAPTWKISLIEEKDNPNCYPSDYYVDMITGEVYGGGSEKYQKSPYASRGCSKSGALVFARQERYKKDYEDLFPLVFAHMDGYTYYITPQSQMKEGQLYPNWLEGELWRKNDATGETRLLDSHVAGGFFGPDEYDGDIYTVRYPMFAAVVGDRIVFHGYKEDYRDVKAGGGFVSINLDGSDRRTYTPKLHSLGMIFVSGERIYYTGWPGNDPVDYPLNYVDILLTKDRLAGRYDKWCFSMNNGVIYGTAAPYNTPSDIIYAYENGEWREAKRMGVPIRGVANLFEQNAWLILHEDGTKELFRID